MTANDKPGDGAGGARKDQAARAREISEKWLAQLQEMIDQTGKHAGPVLRDVAAKAAELAAVAAEHAGPAVRKAADVTDHVGTRLAARSKTVAADLHRSADQARAARAAEAAGKPEEPGPGPKA
jgi:hypothetical protein